MYKITLYDNNCCPIADGTTFWFVEDLKEFEKKWLPLQAKQNVETIEKYYRSKFGEIVTDYYSNDTKLNIVQNIEADVLDEKIFEYENKEVHLFNAYGCGSTVLFDKLKIALRILKYEDKHYLVGQYFGYGCRRVEDLYNRWYDITVKYCQMHFYGNPIGEYTSRNINWENTDKPDAYKDFYTNDKDFYKHEKVETFVWLPIKEISCDEKIKELNEEEISCLLRDIVGEAG
jgi:hypothetical protein